MINSAIKQIALVVGSTLIAMAGVHAQTPCPDASGDTTVSSSCDTGISLTSANLTIGTPTSGLVEVSNPGNIVIKVLGTGNTIDNTVNGSIVETSYGIGIYNEGTINALTNSGLISSEEGGVGIDNRSTISTLINAGSITAVGQAFGIQNYGVEANVTTLTNSGTISAGDGGDGIANSEGIIFTLTNSGTISAGGSGAGIVNFGTIDTLNNSGTISAGVHGIGIYNGGGSSITTLNNSDSISVEEFGNGIHNVGTITSLTNSGTISSVIGGVGIRNTDGGTINILNNSGTISPGDEGVGILNDFTITTLTNSGTISAGVVGYGIANNGGIIDSLTNSGTISAGVGGNGIYNYGGIIGSLTNSGTITNGNTGITNFGTINTLNNSGTISPQTRGLGIFNDGGIIATLNNSGTITSGDLGWGIFNSNGGTINTLNNSGMISVGAEESAVYNYDGVITTLNNSGVITGGDRGYGINNSLRTINTLNNLGSITSGNGGWGIYNQDTIHTLSNAQGGNASSPSTTALTYGGNLPTNYNIIINSATHYGQLATNGLSGVTTFGISPLRKNSTILNTTLTSVLSGVSADQLGLTGLSSFSGLSNGFSYTLYLMDLATNTWGLIVTACNNCDIYSGMSVSLSDIDVTVYPVLAGGTLVLNNGDNSSQAFAVTANSVITSPSTGSATLSGIFSGVGGLTFTGTGTTIMSGANTYSGDTTIASGTLSVAGASPTGTGDVFVASGATLMGTGTITGNVLVSGILKPGNSPGYLSTTSTVTMNAGSSYLQDIAGTVQASSTSPVGAAGYYSFLNVTNGQFVIQPGSTLTPQLSNLFTSGQAGFGSAIYVPGLGDRLRIVTAAGGISGRFSTVTQPVELAAGTQFMPFYNMVGSNSIDLAVIPTSYQTTIAAASGNANAQSVGGALTQIAQASLAGTSTVAQDQLLYAISGQTTAQSIANFAQALAGEVYAATVAVIAQTTQRTQQSVLNRLGDTAGLGLNMPMASASMNTQVGGAPSAAVSSNPNVNPKSEAKSYANGNVWGDLAYQRGNRSSDSQSGGWGSNLYQLTFGSDFYASNGTVAGAGLALSSTTLNPTYGASTIQQGSLFAYGKMPVESFVLDAMASVGLSSSDIKRGDVTGLSAGFRNKSVSGNDVMVSLGLSRPFETESVRLTPFARVTWQMVSQSGVNEGDVASALSVNRYTGNGVRGVIGLAAGSKANNPMTAKNTYRAYVGVGADSSGLLNPTLNASLVGINTNITTPNAGTAFVQAGLYGTAKMSENTFAYAGISGEARSGQTLGTVNVGLKVQF